MVFSFNQETKICNISHLFLLNYFLYKEKHLLYNVFRPHSVSELTDNVVIKQHFDEMNKQKNILEEEIIKIEEKKPNCKICDLEKLYRMKENYDEHLYHLSTAMCNKTINLKTNPIETYFNEKNPIKELKEIEEVEEDFHFIVSEDIQ
jgi:hypothetical protein